MSASIITVEITVFDENTADGLVRKIGNDSRVVGVTRLDQPATVLDHDDEIERREAQAAYDDEWIGRRS
jgi:hypothetical protein